MGTADKRDPYAGRTATGEDVRRSATAARTARFSATLAADQPAISPSVRQQPSQSPSSPITHTPVHGLATSMGSGGRRSITPRG